MFLELTMSSFQEPDSTSDFTPRPPHSPDQQEDAPDSTTSGWPHNSTPESGMERSPSPSAWSAATWDLDDADDREPLSPSAWSVGSWDDIEGGADDDERPGSPSAWSVETVPIRVRPPSPDQSHWWNK